MVLINPYRYISYRYDSDTKLYYLNSRYYNPEWGRFINADGLLNSGNDLLGHNLYSYCWNNIINKIDKNGDAPGELFADMDAAAIDFTNYTNPSSIFQGREYSSYLYEKTIIRINFMGFKYGIIPQFKIKTTRKYSYTKPKKGKKGEKTILKYPPIINEKAILHTHGAYDEETGYGNDYFSIDDMKIADDIHKPIYVATPLGILRKYDPNAQFKHKIVSYCIPWDQNHPSRK